MVPPAVTPMPPVADLSMPWDVDVPDPVDALRTARARHGDTFVVDSGDDRYLFLFSPVGVRSFYALDEVVASKGIADWRMLRRKVPPELFEGRRVLPHDLFGRTEADVQVRSLDEVVPRMVGALEDGDEIDVFAWSRALGNRIGLTSWGGVELLDDPRLPELVDALETLDAAEAFVRPERMAEIAANDHAVERAALEAAVSVLGAVIHRRASTGRTQDDLLDVMIDAWTDEAGDGSTLGAAHDVVLVHLASMSNLFAAIAWTIVDVISRPSLVGRIRGGDHDLSTRCALESIRCAQRSVMLRHVLADVEIETELGILHVDPGTTVATLVPLTNRGPGLEDFDPDRWNGRRLGPHEGQAAAELVTTFGHGGHRCPAQAFSLKTITTTVEQLLTTFDVELLDREPRPMAGQIGGVSRAAGGCRIRLSART